MDRISKLFIKASLVYLAISVVLGLFILIGPGYSFMHSHFTLIGWLSFMVFGVSYQIIPQYSGRPIYSRKMGIIHFWLANIGLIGLALSYPFMRMSMVRGTDYSSALMVSLIFGLIEVSSMFMFIFNIGKSMEK